MELIWGHTAQLADLATIVLAIAAVIGLAQLSLVKFDIRTRNTRLAKKEAVNIIEKYITLCNLLNKIDKKLEELKFPECKFLVDVDELDFNTRDQVDLEIAHGRMRLLLQHEEFLSDVVFAINELSFIAACVNSGLADDEMVCSEIGISYCKQILKFYDLILLLEHEFPRYALGIPQTYSRWAREISVLKAHRKMEEIDGTVEKLIHEKMKVISRAATSNRIRRTPIGTDF